MSEELLYQIGLDLNELHEAYIHEANPKIKKERYKRYSDKAEEYKQAFRSFMHSNSAAKVAETL